MRRRFGWFGFAWVALHSPVALSSQTAAPVAAHPCDAQAGATKAVCRAGYDAMASILPVVALAASGGNPSIGSAAGGKGFGDFSLTIRGTYLRTVLPSTAFDGTVDTVPAARRLPVAIPSLEMRLGLLRKTLPIGAATVDFLGAMVGVPQSATEFVRYSSDTRSLQGLALGFGYGLRIGIEPKGPMPTVSLNVGRHDFPKFTIGDVGSGSQFAYTVAVSAINARLMIGKRFAGLELTAGAGADLIKGSYSLVYRSQATHLPLPRADSTLSTMRILTVVNAALPVAGVFRLSFEGGFQVGKDDKLPTVFQASNPKSGRFFGGVGLGFKL